MKTPTFVHLADLVAELDNWIEADMDAANATTDAHTTRIVVRRVEALNKARQIIVNYLETLPHAGKASQ